MGLREELEPKVAPTKLGVVLELYGDELTDLLADRSVSAEAISRLLKSKGHDISVWPLKKWRMDRGIPGFRG